MSAFELQSNFEFDPSGTVVLQSSFTMKRSVNPKLLLFAMLFVAVLASLAGVHGLSERQHLLRQGVKTSGLVVGIYVGVKGLRNVEARFTTTNGDVVVGRDVHTTQWSDANEIGDQVILHYNPRKPETILIARGLTMWSNPAFLLAAGVLLCGFAVFIYKHSTAGSTSS